MHLEGGFQSVSDQDLKMKWMSVPVYCRYILEDIYQEWNLKSHKTFLDVIL
jgi:hypothetical protein